MALGEFFDRLVARYLVRHPIPIEEAEAILLEELEMLIQNPAVLKVFTGSWRKELDAIVDERKSAKQRKTRFKDKKAALEAEKALDESLKGINYKLLPKANVKSGYIGVYTNSGGWRARVKDVDGNWQFLATHKYPEQAAWERYNWHLENNPLENLDGELLHYFNVYVTSHTRWTFDAALAWAKSQAAFGNNAYSGSDGLTENERMVRQAMVEVTHEKIEVEANVPESKTEATMEEYKRSGIAKRTEDAKAEARAEKDRIVAEHALGSLPTKLTRRSAKKVASVLKAIPAETVAISTNEDDSEPIFNHFAEIADKMEVGDD